VFADIVEPSLHYLGIPPRKGQETNPVLARWPEQLSKAELYDMRRRWPRAAPAVVGNVPMMEELRMPALNGLSARDAVARLVAAGLVPELYGTGWVIGQNPPAGTYLGEGSRCTLILGPRGAQQNEKATRIVDHRLPRIGMNEPADDAVVVDAGS
jgi:hypothetical protein